MNFRMIQAVIKCFERENRPVHALSGIMGNQGKIAKKQSGKIYAYLHISILRAWLHGESEPGLKFQPR